jgi:ATP-dependent Clp protease ATP-binding subunit ClpC
MATRRMCDVCGIRPAVVTVRRIVPGEGQRVEHLCEIHAAEAGVGRSSFEVLEGAAAEAPEYLQVEERT